MAGDCVYRVNGVFGSGEVLLGQLSKDGPLLQLRLWRPNVKMRSKLEGLGHVDFRGSPCGRGHAVAESLAHKQRQLPNLDEDLRQSTMFFSAESAESMVGSGKEPCLSKQSTNLPSVESSVGSGKEPCLSQQSTNVPSIESSVRSVKELSPTNAQSMLSSAKILNMAENSTVTDEEEEDATRLIQLTAIPVGPHMRWTEMREQQQQDRAPPVVVRDLRQPMQSTRVKLAGSS